MEQILNYVKPELVVVAIVLYFVGVGLKTRKQWQTSISRQSSECSVL